MLKKKYCDKTLVLRCQEAIDFFKKTSFTLRGQKTTLYDLPAYLIVGPAQSGKTTLLSKSPLKFILEKKVDRKAAEINSYDFWATMGCVFIDTPGVDFLPPLSSPHKNERFDVFLRALQYQDYQKRLQGIIVVLNIADILSQTESTLQQFTKNLQRQLVNITKKCNTPHLPVFFVINKFDRLAGFIEFFGELSREERWKKWGITLDEDNPTTEKKLIEFQEKFCQLLYRLNGQLMWRLLYEKTIDKRLMANHFLSQMHQLKPHLSRLFSIILKSASRKLNIAGLFFTSATQTPELQTPPKISTTRQEIIAIKPQQARSFFVHNLLTEWIFTKNSTQTNGSLKTHYRYWILKLGFYAIAIAIVIGVGSQFLANIKTEMRLINEAHTTLSEYNVIHKFQQDNRRLSAETQLQLLDILRSTNRALGVQPVAERWALAQHQITKNLHQKMNSTYQHTLQMTLLNLIRDQLAQVLQDDQYTPELQYEYLRAYLMLQKRDQFQGTYFVNAIHKIWEAQYSPLIQQKLDRYLQDTLQAFSQPVLTLDQPLVQNIREKLNHLPTQDLAYIILKNEALNNMPLSLNLNTNKTASRILTLTDRHLHILKMYTAENFTLIYPNLIQKVAQDARIGNWVLGDRPQNDTTLSQEQLVAQVSKLYLQNYATMWVNFLNNIQVVHFTDLSKLNEAIKILGCDRSPLSQLINLVQINLVEPVVQVSPTLQHWSFLNQKKTVSLSPQKMIKSFEALNTYLSAMSDSDHPAQKTFELTQKRLRNQGKHDALEDIFTQSQVYPDPIKGWLYSIGTNIWQLMLYQSQNYLNELWKKDVFVQYQGQLENRFPLNSQANNEISLENFTYFFAPNGLLDNFFTSFLKPFVNTAQTPWTVKILDGNNLQLSSETLQLFMNLYKIQHLYFADRLPKPAISFTLKPISMEESITQATIKIGSQQAVYQNDQSFLPADFIWPDDINTALTEILFKEDNGKQTTISYNSEWGLFKLLQHTLHAQKGHQWRAIFDRNGHAMTLDVSFKQPNNPFSFKWFKDLRFTEEL